MSLFSENLQELMSERNLTQTSLAEAMGTCSSKLSSYITGNRAPNYDTLIQLVEFFHCSADFLLGIKEYPCEEIDYLPVSPFPQRLRTVLKEMNCTQYSFIKQ